MNSGSRFLAAGLAFAALAAPPLAHHSFAMFDQLDEGFAVFSPLAQREAGPVSPCC